MMTYCCLSCYLLGFLVADWYELGIVHFPLSEDHIVDRVDDVEELALEIVALNLFAHHRMTRSIRFLDVIDLLFHKLKLDNAVRRDLSTIRSQIPSYSLIWEEVSYTTLLEANGCRSAHHSSEADAWLIWHPWFSQHQLPTVPSKQNHAIIGTTSDFNKFCIPCIFRCSVCRVHKYESFGDLVACGTYTRLPETNASPGSSSTDTGTFLVIVTLEFGSSFSYSDTSRGCWSCCGVGVGGHSSYSCPCFDGCSK
jgi:hypothetical protein